MNSGVNFRYGTILGVRYSDSSRGIVFCKRTTSVVNKVYRFTDWETSPPFIDFVWHCANPKKRIQDLRRSNLLFTHDRLAVVEMVTKMQKIKKWRSDTVLSQRHVDRCNGHILRNWKEDGFKKKNIPRNKIKRHRSCTTSQRGDIRKKRKSRSGKVYLMASNQVDLVKVGFTKREDIEHREGELNESSYGGNCNYRWVCYLDCPSPKTIEQRLHREWVQYRKEGDGAVELFEISFREALSALITISEELLLESLGFEWGWNPGILRVRTLQEIYCYLSLPEKLSNQIEKDFEDRWEKDYDENITFFYAESFYSKYIPFIYDDLSENYPPEEDAGEAICGEPEGIYELDALWDLFYQVASSVNDESELLDRIRSRIVEIIGEVPMAFQEDDFLVEQVLPGTIIDIQGPYSGVSLDCDLDSNSWIRYSIDEDSDFVGKQTRREAIRFLKIKVNRQIISDSEYEILKACIE